jgi:hypothetical protein
MGIPLVALAGRQQPSVLEQAGQALQLKALQGQISMQPGQLTEQSQKIQAQQQALNDQKARTDALKEWSEVPGSLPPSELPRLILKHGGSADAATKMQQDIIDQQTKLQTLDKDKLANAQTRVNAQGAASQAILSMAPELRPAAYQQKMKELLASGMISPQEAQTPYDEEMVKLHAATAMSAKDQIDTTLKQRETAAQELAAQARMTAANKPPAEITDVNDYTKDYLGSRQLPDTASNRLLARQQYFKDKQPYGAQNQALKQEGMNLREQEAGRKDTDFIDKTYVKPANDVEKSYQMFMDAYNNRNNAKTGAESMLALSTHLTTTFGNVKGARITKDMIEHHLGARGITDSALVAVQKLTNGDVLSPDQWDAFKGLISQSRNLSWGTVQKEAKRRGVDVSGSLPDDVKNPSTTKQNDPLGIR